ncbi:DUF6327 family protein [Maribacter sp. 2307ULW6-5]|uniref:DUF6327 family protein n=1 Tax=Maribacter sp. 2307ULW6-5 TaxID=3386275 RepID=UPI0039BC9BFC
MTKKYSSFSEIDKDLNILRLQREIAMESLKFNLNNTKADLLPNQLLGGASGLLQQQLLTFAIKKLSGIFRKRHSVTVLD